MEVLGKHLHILAAVGHDSLQSAEPQPHLHSGSQAVSSPGSSEQAFQALPEGGSSAESGPLHGAEQASAVQGSSTEPSSQQPSSPERPGSSAESQQDVAMTQPTDSVTSQSESVAGQHSVLSGTSLLVHSSLLSYAPSHLHSFDLSWAA